MFRPSLALFLLAPALIAQEPSLDALKEAGQWKRLRPRIDGWYRTSPGDPYALLWMSRVKLAFNDVDGGLDLARKAAALQPADPEIQGNLGRALGLAAQNADGMMKGLSLARELKKALEASVAAKLDNEEAVQNLLGFYLESPGLVGGREGKAKELAQRFTAIRPLRGLLFQADIAFHAKDPEAAKALIQQVLAKDPKSYDAQIYLGHYHLSQTPKSLDAAAACYRAAAALKPQEIRPYAELASILALQGKWSELDALLAQARQAVPANPWPCYSAARSLILENTHLDHAEGFLRTYLAQEPEGNTPDQAAAQWRLGQLFEKLGRKAEALKAFEAALKLRPQFPQAKKDRERLAKG